MKCLGSHKEEKQVISTSQIEPHISKGMGHYMIFVFNVIILVLP